MVHVHFVPVDNDEHVIDFPFSRDVIELIKFVPWQNRAWNPTAKEWTVKDQSLDYLMKLLVAEGHQVSWTKQGGGAHHQAPKAPKSDGAWAVTLFHRVGPERKDAVFKALSKVLHPDTPTGDHDLMRELLDGRDL